MLSEEGKRVKEELERFNQTKRRLKNLQEELLLWKNLNGALRSASLEEKTMGGENAPYAEKRLIKIQELEEMISKTIDDALAMEDKFLEDIQGIDILSQNLLMKRYMTGKPLKRIIREFNYSERHIFRKYNGAFEEIAEKNKTCH